jgi:hypothetical protein
MPTSMAVGHPPPGAPVLALSYAASTKTRPHGPLSAPAAVEFPRGPVCRKARAL